MIQFTINSFSHGLTDRPYNSIKDAIQDGGSYSVWCNEKIKLAFSFGNGNEQETHIQFIREQLNRYNDL